MFFLSEESLSFYLVTIPVGLLATIAFLRLGIIIYQYLYIVRKKIHQSNKNYSKIEEGTTIARTRTIVSFLYDELLPRLFCSNTHPMEYYLSQFHLKHDLWSVLSFIRSGIINENEEPTLINIEKSILLLGQWLILAGLTMIFVHFVIANPELTSQCGTYKSEARCISDYGVSDSIIRSYLRCHWDSENEECYFVELPTKARQLTIMVTTMCFLVSICMLPLQYVLRICLRILFVDYTVEARRRSTNSSAQYLSTKQQNSLLFNAIRTRQVYAEEAKAAQQSYNGALIDYNDEFQALQSRKTVLMRCVRLYILQRTIDYIPVSQEWKNLISYPKVEPWTQKPEAFDGKINFLNALKSYYKTWQYFLYTVGSPVIAWKLINHGRFRHIELICHRIRYSRARAADIRNVLLMNSHDSRLQDLILMKFFCVEWMRGCDQSLLYNILLEEEVRFIFFHHKYTDAFRRVIRRTVFFFYVALVCAIIYGGASLTRSEAILFVVVHLVSFAFYQLIICPYQIFISVCILPRFIQADFIRLFNNLVVRLPRIIRRDKGYLSRVHAFIQHFNPACRAARFIPGLPISRLLITLHDHDFPTADRTPWQPFFKIVSTDTGSPLISDFCEISLSNWYLRLRFAFFRMIHYTKLSLKGLLHCVVILSTELREGVIEFFLFVFFYAIVIGLLRCWFYEAQQTSGLVLEVFLVLINIIIICYGLGIESNLSGRKDPTRLIKSKASD